MSGRTSVLIPCYNCQQYLGEALASVAAQTRPVLEIIVLDDGSREPVTAPANWAGPPLRIIRTENRGLPAARNRAAREAKGEFLGLLDADDAWEPAKIESQEDALDADPSAAASFTRLGWRDNWLPLGQREYPRADVPDNDFWLELWQHNFITPSSMLIRREAFARAGGFDETLRYCEDFEFWYRLLALGRFIQLPFPLTSYRRHPEQMTQHTARMAEYGHRARLRIIELHGSRLEAAGLSRAAQRDSAWNTYRSAILMPYFQREMTGARRLLWGYLRHNPFDAGIWRYALLSLLPGGLLRRLRGQVNP